MLKILKSFIQLSYGLKMQIDRLNWAAHKCPGGDAFSHDKKQDSVDVIFQSEIFSLYFDT